MNPKTCKTICIVLAILIALALVRAATNKGRLYGEEESFLWFGEEELFLWFGENEHFNWIGDDLSKRKRPDQDAINKVDMIQYPNYQNTIGASVRNIAIAHSVDAQRTLRR